MSVNIPNILTFIRIAAIPLMVVVYYLPLKFAYPLSAFIFLLAAITDWADGYLARKLNQSSEFGAFLDPIADKLIVAAALVIIVHKHGSLLLVIPSLIIIGREIAVSGLREWMSKLGKRKSVKVSFTGKVKTIMQMVAVFLLLYKHPVYSLPIFDIGQGLLIVAAILTLGSMFQYLYAAYCATKEPTI